MAINYKTLFEVKIMHEFYQTGQDGNSVFSFVDQKDRLTFLLDQFSRDRTSVNNDLSYQFPESQRQFYEAYHLKLLPSYSGFRVVVRVRKKIELDNSIVFEPFIALPGDLQINVLLSRKSPSIDQYTNFRVKNPLPSIYFFNNESNKVFPYLTSPVIQFQPGFLYEQGELASFGQNDIRSFYFDAISEQWEPVIGRAFANENDRTLLPFRFNYSFPSSSNVTSADFNLKDTGGNVIHSVNYSEQSRIDKVSVDLTGKKELLSMPLMGSISNSVFSLEVGGSDGYNATHVVMFSDILSSDNIWAVSGIRCNGGDPLFSLVDDNGNIKRRKNATGTWTDHPVFEIPVKSKFAYWRYRNERGKKLDLTPDLQDYLFEEDGILISKKPRAIANSWFLLNKEGSTDTKYVPNPVNYQLVKDNKQRLCFDIMVPKSAMFPVLP